MKFSHSPSLYIFFLLACLSLLFINSINAQIKRDSTDFYGSVLLNPSDTTDIALAFNYLKSNVPRDLKNRDTLAAIRKLSYLAIGQIEMGAYYEGEETLTDALKLLDKLPTHPSVTESQKGLYNHLGMVYRNLKNYSNALRFYNESLKFCLTANDSMVILNNKGNLYNDMGNYSLAEKQFRTVYEISLKSPDSAIQAKTLANLGYSQSKLYHPDAFKNMEAALKMRLKQNNLSALYSSYSQFANYYHARSQQKEALAYAQKGYEIAHRIKSPVYIENSLINILKIRDDSISREYIQLNDSIEQSKLQKRNKYAGMQYNISLEKKKTEENRLLQEKEKRKKQGFQFLGILLLIILIAGYFIQRSQSRKNTIKQIYNTETRISKRVHDEVANDVYHLMTKIQLNIPESDPILDDLEGIYKKTRNISRENAPLNLNDNFGSQLNDLLQSYQQTGTVISVQNISIINWNSISADRKTTIYRVLQELMINMKKHSKASQVFIRFYKNGKKLHVNYVDNGVGCELNNKNGLQNAENRIKAIGGTINFETAPQKGFKITLII